MTTKKHKRTYEEIVDQVTRAINEHGPLSREEIDKKTGYKKTCENHLEKLRKNGVVYISGYILRTDTGPDVALFSVGNKPDVKKPVRPSKFAYQTATGEPMPKPSTPLNRVVFVSAREAIEDAKFRKQYKPTPKRISIGWLGAV